MKKAIRHVFIVLMVHVLAGCGAGSSPDGFGEGHVDILIGASEEGGGALVVDYHDADEPIGVSFSSCIGGSGDDCEGGVVLYSSEDPGFGPVEEPEPDEGVFPLEEGTEVSIEITAIDSGASIFIGDTTLDAVGESAVIGTAIEGLHVHGEWRLVLPGGEEPLAAYNVEFMLTTTDALYEASESFAVTLTVVEADE
jgi:hypothetical protein